MAGTTFHARILWYCRGISAVAHSVLCSCKPKHSFSVSTASIFASKNQSDVRETVQLISLRTNDFIVGDYSSA